MFQLYRKATGRFRNLKVGSALITILAFLLVVSGTVDLIFLFERKCSSKAFENYHCSQKWFFVNVAIQILAGMASSYTVIKTNLTKRPEDDNDGLSFLTTSSVDL